MLSYSLTTRRAVTIATLALSIVILAYVLHSQVAVERAISGVLPADILEEITNSTLGVSRSTSISL